MTEPHYKDVDALAARLKKAGIDPLVLSSLIWSVRPARIMTGDDIEVLADRIASKFGVMLRQMSQQAAVDQYRESRREVLDELRGLVRIELEQLITELSAANGQASQHTANGKPNEQARAIQPSVKK